MTEEAVMLTQQAGNTDVRNSRRMILRALTVESSILTGVKMAGFEAPMQSKGII